MKNQIRNLIIAAVVLIILVGGFLFLRNLGAGKEEIDESSLSSVDTVNTGQVLWDEKKENLKEFHIQKIDEKTNKKTEYTVKNENDEYVIDDLKNLPRNDGAYSLFDTGLFMEAKKVIKKDEAQDLGSYGLLEPNLVISATFSDKEIELKVGDNVPGSDELYAMTSGNDDIYILTNSDIVTFKRVEKDFIALSIGTEGDPLSAEVKELFYGGTSQNGKDIKLVLNKDIENSETLYMSSSHKMVEPVESDTHSDVLYFASAVIGIKPASVEAYNITEADYEKYGLDNPFIKVNAKYALLNEEGNAGEEENLSYIVGNKNEDGLYYVIKEGVPVVYLVAENQFGYTNSNTQEFVSYLNMDYTKYLSKLIFLPHINTVAEIKLIFTDASSTGKKEYIIKQTRAIVVPEETSSSKEEASKSDEKAEPTYEITDVTINGTSVDVANYRKLYQFIIGINGENGATDEEVAEFSENEYAYRVEYSYFDKDDVNWVELIPIDQRNVLIKAADKTTFTMRSSYLEKLEKNIQLIISGEEIVSTDW